MMRSSALKPAVSKLLRILFVGRVCRASWRRTGCHGARQPAGSVAHVLLRTEATADGTDTGHGLDSPPALGNSRWAGFLRHGAAVFALALPALLWWLHFKPALMSADSLEVWAWANGAPASDWHPPLYLLLMYLSRVVSGSPAALAVGQCVLMAACLYVLGRRVAALTDRRLLTWTVVGMVAVSPMFGAFSISLWKDIPFTAVALLAAERLLVVAGRPRDPVSGRRHIPVVQLCAIGALMALFRQNGVIFVAVIGAALLLARASVRAVAATVAVPVLLLGVAKTFVYPAAGIAPAPATLNFAPTFLDVGAVVHQDPGALTEFEVRSLEHVQPLEAWFNGYSCETVNPLIFNTAFDREGIEQHSVEYVAAWASMVRRAPMAVVRSRLCTADPAYAPGPFGQRADLYTVSQGIDPNALGLQTSPLSAALHDGGARLLRWLDHPDREWFAWRAPTWAYLLLAVWGVQRLRRRNPWPLLAVSFPLLFLVSAGALAIAPDARYTFGAWIGAIVLLPIAVGPRAAGSTPEQSAARCEAPAEPNERTTVTDPDPADPPVTNDDVLATTDQRAAP